MHADASRGRDAHADALTGVDADAHEPARDQSPPSGRVGEDPACRVDAEAIRRAHAQWVAAINAGDYTAPEAMAIWAPDLRGWTPYAPETSRASEADGLEELAATYPPFSSARPTFAFEMVELAVHGDIAFAHGLWTQTDARGVAQPTMRSFEVWRRQHDGAWRMSRYLESPK